MTYVRYKLLDKEIKLWKELEMWGRQYEKHLHSTTLSRILDSLEKERKEERRASAHYRKGKAK